MLLLIQLFFSSPNSFSLTFALSKRTNNKVLATALSFLLSSDHR